MAKLHEKYYKHRDLIRELLSDYEINSAEDLSNALKEVFAGTIQDMLEAELDEHLGYEKNESGIKPTQDRRNGIQKKKIISHMGESEITVPRDRDGSFQPQIVAKGQKDIIRYYREYCCIQINISYTTACKSRCGSKSYNDTFFERFCLQPDSINFVKESCPD